MASPLILVTGASRGFGRSIAVALGSALAREGGGEGASLVLWARDATGLKETADLVATRAPSVRTTTRVVDLSDTDGLPAHWRSVEELHPAGTVSRAFLVQNAGSLGRLEAVADVTEYGWLGREVALNITAPFVLASLFLRWAHGGAGPALPGQSVIVNVSSLAAVQPFRCWSAYCTGEGRLVCLLSRCTRRSPNRGAGKAARDMLHRCIATEEAEAARERGDGAGAVRTLSYAPGPLDTDMQARERERAERSAAQQGPPLPPYPTLPHLPWTLQREIRESATLEAGTREQFAAMKAKGALIDPDVSALRCVRLLLGGEGEGGCAWASGDHVDFYDAA